MGEQQGGETVEMGGVLQQLRQEVGILVRMPEGTEGVPAGGLLVPPEPIRPVEAEETGEVVHIGLVPLHREVPGGQAEGVKRAVLPESDRRTSLQARW